MRIFFIRHGETTGDIEDRYGGDYDDHLSEKGLQQSRKLSEILNRKGIEIILSSPLIRAQETSQILAQVIGCDVVTVPELKERNQYGILTGMVKADAKQAYPESVELLKDKYNTIEEGESYLDFTNRLQNIFKRLTDDATHDVIAIVSHGGGFRALFRDILTWGELKEVGDCSFVELENRGLTFSYIDSSGIVPDFEWNTHR